MLYMVVEQFKTGGVNAVYERLRVHGRLLPHGLQFIESWVDLNYERCYQLMETDDPTLFESWIAAWSDLVDFEIVAVQSGADARAHATQNTTS